MKIVIVGAGAVGTHLSKLLSREHQDCVLINDDDERLAALSEYDVMTYNASPTSIQALNEAGVPHADLFVGVTPEETTNLTACMIAHSLGAKKTVARIDNYEYLKPNNKELFKQMGIDSLIYPEVLAAIDINNGLKLSWVRQRWDVHDGALTLLGIKLREAAEILNQPLRELCGPDDPYHIVAIKRGEDTIIPGGLDELRVGDLAYFMTTQEYIPYIRKIVGKEHYADVKNVIVMGGDKTAVRAALTAPDYMNIKIIDKDARRCDRLNELLGDRDTMVIHGDGLAHAKFLGRQTGQDVGLGIAGEGYERLCGADALLFEQSEVTTITMNHHRVAVAKQFIELFAAFGILLDDLDVHIVGSCECSTDGCLITTHHNHVLYISIVLLTHNLADIGDVFLSGHEIDEVTHT